GGPARAAQRPRRGRGPAPLEGERLMAVLPIRISPDPCRRQKAQAVESFDAALRRLVADMVETMVAAPGVGLAAPQVGVSQQVAVVALSVGKDPLGLHVLINPKVVEQEGLDSDVEGCLSLP